MSYILDAVVLLIIVVSAIIGSKRGFVKTVIGMVCFLLIILLSFTLSSKSAGIIYDNFVEKKIVSSVSAKLDDAGYNIINGAVSTTTEIADIVDNAIESSSFFGMTPASQTSEEEIQKEISSSKAKTSEELATELSQKIVKPPVTRILETVLFLILFVGLSLLVKPVTVVVCKMFTFSVIGKINKLLGFISGAFIGIVISVAFVNIVYNYVGMSQTEILGITNDTFDKTILFGSMLNLL